MPGTMRCDLSMETLTDWIAMRHDSGDSARWIACSAEGCSRQRCPVLLRAQFTYYSNLYMRPGPSGSAVDLGDTCRARDDGRLRRGWGYKGHRRSILFHRSSTSRPHDTRGP